MMSMNQVIFMMLLNDAGKYLTEWKHAMESEYNSLLENDTWDLAPPPENKNVVSSKWSDFTELFY